jgi:hypothetical protein
MMTAQYGTLCVLTLVGLLASPVMGSEALSALPAAPVPIQVLSAKKVFLSNLGSDAGASAAFLYIANPGAAYNGFAAAMNSWGKYELTATPEESDLVLEFRVTAAQLTSGTVIQRLTYLNVSVLDTKSHYVLWTLKSPLQVTKQIDADVKVSVATLIDSMKSLTAVPKAPPG